MSSSLIPNKKQIILILGVFIGLSMFLVLISISLGAYTSYEFTTWIQVFTSAGSLVLTILIVIVYVKLANLDSQQVEITSRQAEIQANQNSMMKYQQKPVLIVQDYEVGPAKEIVDFEVEDDTEFWQIASGLRITLENAGEGLAENLRLRIIGILQIDNGFKLFEEEGIIVPGTGLSEGRVSHRVSLMSGRSGSLGPGVTQDFIATIASSVSDGEPKDISAALESIAEQDEEPVPLGNAIREIDSEVSMIIFQIDITYEYLGVFSGEEMLLRVAADPEDIDTIRDIFDKGYPISQQEAVLITEYLDKQERGIEQ